LVGVLVPPPLALGAGVMSLVEQAPRPSNVASRVMGRRFFFISEKKQTIPWALSALLINRL
jgi:hypothetical protein